MISDKIARRFVAFFDACFIIADAFLLLSASISWVIGWWFIPISPGRYILSFRSPDFCWLSWLLSYLVCFMWLLIVWWPTHNSKKRSWIRNFSCFKIFQDNLHIRTLCNNQLYRILKQEFFYIFLTVKTLFTFSYLWNIFLCAKMIFSVAYVFNVKVECSLYK